MKSQRPTPKSLPESFVIALDNVSAISLSGEEQVKYLQGQVTCDVNELTSDKLLHGAHCDAKGKVLSVFRVAQHQQHILLIQPTSTVEFSLAELKKFGVFAKVDIEQASSLAFACLSGAQAREHLKRAYQVLPDEMTPVIHSHATTVIYLAGNITRYLVIDSPAAIDQLIADCQLPQLASDVWQLLEISEGFPLLSANAVQHYVPQMLNLDKIHGISFTKGCYLGQETVARMQYLGKNKKAMALLTGSLQTQLADDVAIEKQLGENWRSAGDVLSFYQADNGDCYIQAVVANDLTSEDKLRIKQHEDDSLHLTPLPYTHS